MHNALYYGVLAIAATSVSARAVPGLSPRHAFGTTGQCAPQPLGSGPVTNNPDTAEAFVANPAYANSAKSASAPKGYAVAYQNKQAASTTGGYLGYETLTSYDVNYCAAQCSTFWPGCKSFNIYFERDPTVDPGDNCPNPSSTTNIKCSYWTESLTPSDATNDGQYCADFHIVIAGSNGYNVIPSASTTSAVFTTTSNAASTTTSKAATTTPAAPSTITACPVPETTYTAVDGSTWAVCKGADFQGQTNEDVHKIYNANDCAAACASRTGCTKGVFFSAGSVCYIKGGPYQLVWVVNPTYDTVRQLTPASGPKTITACPTAELRYTASDGSTWAICQNTDYRGNTYNAVPKVSNENACAEKCAKDTAGCVKAVFDAGSKQCYLKNGGLNWVVDNRYDTVRELTGPTNNNNGWNTWSQPKPKTCNGWTCW